MDLQLDWTVQSAQATEKVEVAEYAVDGETFHHIRIDVETGEIDFSGPILTVVSRQDILAWLMMLGPCYLQA